MKKKEKSMNYLALEYKQMELYFEKMARKGWKLTGFEDVIFHRASFACFEEIAPHPIQYCVDFIQNDSYEYFEACKFSGWNYVDSNRYFHIFMHEGEFIEPLQSDQEIEAVLVKENLYHKELNRFYRGLLLFAFIFCSGIARILGYGPFGEEQIVINVEDVFLIGSFICYIIYTVLMVEITKRMVKKQSFLSRHRKPLSRFLGIYPFSVVSVIFIVYGFVWDIRRGEPIIDGFLLFIAIIVTVCILGWEGFKRKTDQYVDTLDEKIDKSS